MLIYESYLKQSFPSLSLNISNILFNIHCQMSNPLKIHVSLIDTL